TPSKRMRIMSAAVSQTSASYLVSKAHMPMGKTIPAPVFMMTPQLLNPDWSLLAETNTANTDVNGTEYWRSRAMGLEESLRRAQQQLAAREQISAGQNAQIIIQDLTLRKLNKTLNTKEKKDEDRTKLYPSGNGRHMTDGKFVEELKKDQRKRVAKVEAKRLRKEVRVVKQGENATLKARWEEIKTKHAEEVKMWEAECEELTRRGVQKKELPKRPKHLPK
ncbi:hypothetical protein PAXINDRAFT_44318, partial [Paxillus involutus ATCC 200175]